MSIFIPPDWRDPEAYPAKADEWLLGQWAWAFLRRNPDYQKDYTHFASLPSYYANGTKTAKWCAKTTSHYGDAKLRYCKYPILPGEAVVEYVARTGDQSPYEYSIEAHLMQKWSIDHIADPANDEGSYCISFTENLPLLMEREYIFDHEKKDLVIKDSIPAEIYEETLRFDLRYSIEKQLMYAKDYLLSRRDDLKQFNNLPKKPPKSGINRKFLPKYLRAYDAYQTGATNLEIAKNLWTDRKIEINKSRYDLDNAKDANEQLAQRATTKGIELVMGGYKEFMKLVV